MADCPGFTVRDDGVTVMSKSAAGGSTLIFRAGGEGSELFAASIRVNEATYSPAEPKVTFPGVLIVEVDGEPPGKIHEYLVEVVAESKNTVEPALMVTSPAVALIAPDGAAADIVSTSTHWAFDGTPAEASRNT